VIRIGTSGWSYDHWEGVLYPHGTPLSRRLNHYVERFDTVELNSSYYHWPRDTAFQSWRQRLPPEFLMSLKAPRGLTHYTRLYSPERWIARISRGLDSLGPRLGVLLLQLSPQLAYDEARLRYFLERWPPAFRLACEFRHESWHREEVFRLLEQFGAAYCVMSGARLPCILRATAPFVYVRLHGPDTEHLYGGSYSDDDLRWWAGRIHEWQAMGKDLFAYFNNDWAGTAVRNAERLRELLAAG
jgi:uncharacterized protein YecE (DUF72 family)